MMLCEEKRAGMIVDTPEVHNMVKSFVYLRYTEICSMLSPKSRNICHKQRKREQQVFDSEILSILISLRMFTSFAVGKDLGQHAIRDTTNKYVRGKIDWR